MSQILITGGAGFIGANAAKYFSDLGHNVYLFDNLSRPTGMLNVSWLSESGCTTQLITGDLRNWSDVSDAFRRVEPDYILHLGAQVAVTTSVKSPREDFETNALGTLNVLEALRLLRPEARLIFSSTNKVYGALDGFEIREEDERISVPDLAGVSESTLLDFYSPYGCSKGAADQYVADYRRIYGLDAISVRQSCIYGPRQFGVEDQGWLSWFAIQAIREKSVTIYGSGKQVRDVLHVQDLLELYERILSTSAWPDGAINAGGGSGNSLSLLEYLGLLEEKFGLPLQHSFAKARPGDQLWFVSDNTKASQAFGWSPTTTIDEGLKGLIEFSRSLG